MVRALPRLSTHFAILLFGSLGLLAVLYAVELRAIAAGLPEGLLVGIVQCVAELIGVAVLLRRCKILPWLVVGLLAFAIADFFWVYLFYYLKTDRKTLAAIFLTHIPYGIGYWGLGMTLLQRLRESAPFKSVRWMLAGLLVFTVPFYARFIFVPALQTFLKEGNLLYYVAHTFNTLGCFALINVAVLTIAYLRDLRWSMLGIGGACLVMENWAFRAEMLLVGAPGYGFYDYFWAFGILTIVYPMGYRETLERRETFDPKSLRTRTRFWIVGSSLVFLSLLAVFATPNSIIVRFLAVGTVLTLLLSVFAGQFLTEQIEELSTRLSFKLTGDLGISGDREKELPSELQKVYDKVFREKIEEKRVVLRLQEELSQHAARVSHDIRSPLAALDLVMEELSDMSEQKRNLVRSAVGRINDIANQMLQLSKEKRAVALSSPVGPELIWPILDEILTEKRWEYRDKVAARLELTVEPGLRDAFAQVDRGALRSALSNVLNNAIQAAPNGLVSAILRRAPSGGALDIEIRDSGPGIPAEVLRHLGEEWNTAGKSDGTGLGLSNSMQALKSMGAQLFAGNHAGGGAVVTLRLSSSDKPDWYCPRLELPKESYVIVLDDDEPIHRAWGARLRTLVPSDRLICFSTVSDFLRKAPTMPEALYLVDYELIGQNQNGLQVIESLKLQARSILVTGRHEDSTVRHEAERLGVSILPKVNLAFVPIQIEGVHATLQ